jgi:hypothetical protein
MVAEKRWGEARCQAEEVCAAAAGDQEKKRVQRSKKVLLAARASIAAAAALHPQQKSHLKAKERPSQCHVLAADMLPTFVIEFRRVPFSGECIICRIK